MSALVIPDLTVFDNQIKKMIEARIKERGAVLATEIMNDYTKSIHEMFREVTASVCLELFRMISMERYGQKLEIVIHDKTTEAK
jgi:hypothetical protein